MINRGVTSPPPPPGGPRGQRGEGVPEDPSSQPHPPPSAADLIKSLVATYKKKRFSLGALCRAKTTNSYQYFHKSFETEALKDTFSCGLYRFLSEILQFSDFLNPYFGVKKYCNTIKKSTYGAKLKRTSGLIFFDAKIIRSFSDVFCFCCTSRREESLALKFVYSF